MTVRVFGIGTTITAVGSTAIWLAIINYLAPAQAGLTGFFLFFLTLFLSIASLASLLGYFLRRFIARDILAAYAVRTSLRQGIILGLFFDLLLILQLVNLYTWWLTIIIVSLFTTVELIFLSYDRTHYRHPRRSPA